MIQNIGLVGWLRTNERYVLIILGKTIPPQPINRLLTGVGLWTGVLALCGDRGTELKRPHVAGEATQKQLLKHRSREGTERQAAQHQQSHGSLIYRTVYTSKRRSKRRTHTCRITVFNQGQSVRAAMCYVQNTLWQCVMSKSHSQL